MIINPNTVLRVAPERTALGKRIGVVGVVTGSRSH